MTIVLSVFSSLHATTHTQSTASTKGLKYHNFNTQRQCQLSDYQRFLDGDLSRLMFYIILVLMGLYGLGFFCSMTIRCLCAIYFAKCATKLFRMQNAIGGRRYQQVLVGDDEILPCFSMYCMVIISSGDKLIKNHDFESSEVSLLFQAKSTHW